MLMEKLKALQHIFNEDRVKAQKYAETIQVLQKDFKLEKAAITAADKSTCLHSDNFEINTYKSQVNESVLVAQLIENCLLSSLKNIFQTYSRGSCFIE